MNHSARLDWKFYKNTMSNNNKLASQPLKDLITVRQSGVRSVNVENDQRNAEVASGYVLTTQSRACLGRMLAELNSAAPHRSWTLTGPYGSGKSYYGLFLLNLLNTAQPGHARALAQLRSVDAPLAEQVSLQGQLHSGPGFLSVAITGYRAPFQECLARGLQQALKPLASDPRINESLNQLEAVFSAGRSRALVSWLQELISVLTADPFKYAGLLLIFDEMGKPLEFVAAHPDEADIYLLQELAEYANRSGDQRFVFVGILHQAFERYAVLMDSTTQREWAKVQGRFEDIAFQEPPAQQMWLLANALEYQHPAEMNSLIEKQHADADRILESGWRPPAMKPEEVIDLACRTYPLHPTTLIALPHIFRRLAQNERSIFAYLASHEPFGFREYLEQHTAPEVVRLADLFDYLAANFQGRLYASGRARALTETLERLNNSIRLTALEANVLKTIGLLNWLGEVSHLQATEACLLGALVASDVTEEDVRQSLRNLQQRSVIVYRRFNQSYSIWQGSDVDIEERLQRAHEALTSAFSLAQAVQRFMPPRPLAARRHSYQTGTLRYFEVRYIDAQTRDQLNQAMDPGASGLALLCLPGSFADVEMFRNWAQIDLKNHRNVLVGIAGRTTRLNELLQELRCLNWVGENTPELRDDPVARRELRTRISAVESLIRNELQRSISLHRLSESAGCTWYWQGNEMPSKPGESLSHLLSIICDDLYTQSPLLWNELVNRRSLSTQAAAARRNLIEALLMHTEEPGLGIEGYPPERSMYESLLAAGGLHTKTESGRWQLTPPAASDPLKLLPVWEELGQSIFTPTPELRPLQDVYNRLMATPYGVTEGVLPVLLFVFWSVHQNEMTLYREGTLLPEPRMADWEVLLRRPDLFSVAGCRVSGTRLAIVQRLARGLQTESAIMPVVRTLVRKLKQLPEYAWRTQHLPEPALNLRQVTDQARSPERYLFYELPAALGLSSFDDERTVTADHLEVFFQQLNTALEALMTATPRRRDWARDVLLTASGLPTGTQGWDLFCELAEAMLNRTTNPQLLPLLKRTAEAADSQTALDSALAFIANRPMRTWTDADVERYAMQAQFLGNLLQQQRSAEETERLLTPAQRQRSQQMAADLQAYLSAHFDEPPAVLQAALRRLLQQWDAPTGPDN